MLKTYITIAYRNFVRNKLFSLIHVMGLSIGICASLVIFLIVHYDFTFDKFEKNRDQLYRVVMDMNFSGTDYHNSGVPSPMPAAAKKEIPGIVEVIGFHSSNGEPKVVTADPSNKKIFSIKHQTGIALADKSYFNLVNYEWITGSPKTALEEPFKVVLTSERAKIYFPSTDFSSMIGKQVVYDDSITATVAGIVKEIPNNTDFQFKEFISQSTIPATGWKNNYSWDSWSSVNGGSQFILRLAPNASVKKVEAQILDLEKKNLGTQVNDHSKRTYHLQPFDEIHFNAVYGTFGNHTAHKPTLYGLLAVAAFLLILACINFINLATAQSSQRAKEIGVRKTLGSSGKQLIFQFLTESFLISFVSLLCSIMLVPVLLKIFSDFIPADLHFDIFHQPYLIGFAFLLTIVVAFVAGFYPALVLSRFKPVAVLKNQAHQGGGRTRRAMLRKSLTVSQFLIAQVFTMATLIAVKQIHYVLNKDMGFKKDAIVNVEIPWNFNRSGKSDSRRMVLLEEVKKMPGVLMVSLGGGTPATDGWSSNIMQFKDGKKEIEADVRQKFGDTSYLKLFQIPLLAGRNVRMSDTANEYVINETYLHVLGMQKPADVLNKQINKFPVVGVMADFNQESLHERVKPIAFSSEMGNCWTLHVALKTGESQAEIWKTTIASIEKSFKQLFPEETMNYWFMDQSIKEFYTTEQNLSSLLKWATGLAIFISCMGLLGLVMYTTTQRTKEIGVRKVLGASITHIVRILSTDFIQLVIIASFIAVPITWYAMQKWLDNFAYRTPVQWWIFLLSTLFMMVIALVTLSIQTFRAANANPVESLRSE